MGHVITCSFDGTVQQVQNDAFPLYEIGRVSVERASDVFFNEDTQEWVAVIREKFRIGNGPHEYAHKSRTVCIEWEVEYLNRRM